MLNCRTEIKAKRSSHFRDNSWSKIKQSGWLNQTVKLFEMTESICWFYLQPIYKNQHCSSIQSWRNADSILGITFEILRWAWVHPYECAESNKRYLCTPKNMHKINFTTQVILEISLIRCFESLWACLIRPTWNDWINLSFFWMPNFM